MALGEYRPPNQINSDEDKYGYGRISFTKIQILYIAIAFVIGMGVLFLLSRTHIVILTIIGVAIVVALCICAVIFGGATLPNSKYLSGGGLRVDMYVFRKLRKKLSRKNKVLYCRNINRDSMKSYRENYNYRKDGEENKTSVFEDIKQLLGGGI